MRPALRRLACALVVAVAGTSSAPAVSEVSPADDGKIVLAFMGDSMVDGLWGGVTRLIAKQQCLVSKFKLLRFGESGTGLTRPNKFDWIGEAQTILRTRKPTITLISIGLNDRQSIVDTTRHRFDLGTPAWRTKYGELVTGFAKAAATSPAGVLWLGIPVMRDQISQKDAAEKNAIFSETLGALKDDKIAFVEAWHQNSPPAPDTFQPYGAGIGGAHVQLRAPDGIHFTSAGYDVVAKYIFPRIVEQLKQHKFDLGPSCGV